MSALICEFISGNTSPVCLFSENPNRLVSLWEIMRPFQAHLFTHLCFILGQMHQITKTADADNGPNPESVEVMREASKDVLDSCSYLGLKLSIIQLQESEKLVDKALADAILNGNGRGWPFANRALFDAAKRLKDDLSHKMFLALPDDSGALFASQEPFGPDVPVMFPKAVEFDDICEAAKCLALERWTACVFHSMRVLEHGLHQVADNLKVQWPKPWPLDFEQWAVIIDQIELRIRDLEKLPKGTYKTETLQAYSQLATGFRYFKDAWRNHVSHSRVSYVEYEAQRIFSSVDNFMRDAAKVPALP